MINTLKPGADSPRDQQTDVLKRITEQYGKPEEKEREPVKKLGKDEFFKMMVQQMQHQDPLKPYQNEEMAAQLAQFSALEQMSNVNQNFDKLIAAQAPLQQLGAAALIGKYVTADGSRIMHNEGKKSELKFDLPKDAEKVRVTVLNEKGESVREIDAGVLTKGENKIMWDGKRGNKMPAPSGNYSIHINAEDANGRPIQVQTKKTEMVSGIGFEGKETILYVGDPKSPKKMPLKNVSRIIDGAAGGGAPAEAAPENPFAAMLEAQGIKPGAPQQQGEENSDEPAPADIAAALASMGFPAGLGAASGVAKPHELNLDEDIPMEGYVPGKMSQYTQFQMPGKQEQKPAPTNQVKHAPNTLGEKMDLSGPNPAAAERLAKEGSKGVDLRDIGEAEDFSRGKSVQSSAEQSTAGKLME